MTNGLGISIQNLSNGLNYINVLTAVCSYGFLCTKYPTLVLEVGVSSKAVSGVLLKGFAAESALLLVYPNSISVEKSTASAEWEKVMSCLL